MSSMTSPCASWRACRQMQSFSQRAIFPQTLSGDVLVQYVCTVTVYVCTFSPLADVSLCDVAGLVESFPSFPVSGSFLPHLPGVHVLSNSIPPSKPGPFSSALPLCVNFCDYSIFSVLYVLFTCPNHSNLLFLMTITIRSTFAFSRIS